MSSNIISSNSRSGSADPEDYYNMTIMDTNTPPDQQKQPLHMTVRSLADEDNNNEEDENDNDSDSLAPIVVTAVDNDDNEPYLSSPLFMGENQISIINGSRINNNNNNNVEELQNSKIEKFSPEFVALSSSSGVNFNFSHLGPPSATTTTTSTDGTVAAHNGSINSGSSSGRDHSFLSSIDPESSGNSFSQELIALRASGVNLREAEDHSSSHQYPQPPSNHTAMRNKSLLLPLPSVSPRQRIHSAPDLTTRASPAVHSNSPGMDLKESRRTYSEPPSNEAATQSFFPLGLPVVKDSLRAAPALRPYEDLLTSAPSLLASQQAANGESFSSLSMLSASGRLMRPSARRNSFSQSLPIAFDMPSATPLYPPPRQRTTAAVADASTLPPLSARGDAFSGRPPTRPWSAITPMLKVQPSQAVTLQSHVPKPPPQSTPTERISVLPAIKTNRSSSSSSSPLQSSSSTTAAATVHTTTNTMTGNSSTTRLTNGSNGVMKVAELLPPPPSRGILEKRRAFCLHSPRARRHVPRRALPGGVRRADWTAPATHYQTCLSLAWASDDEDEEECEYQIGTPQSAHIIVDEMQQLQQQHQGPRSPMAMAVVSPGKKQTSRSPSQGTTPTNGSIRGKRSHSNTSKGQPLEDSMSSVSQQQVIAQVTFASGTEFYEMHCDDDSGLDEADGDGPHVEDGNYMDMYDEYILVGRP